jgi:FlaA1/EpsC-like NDP-sugar epimerase
MPFDQTREHDKARGQFRVTENDAKSTFWNDTLFVAAVLYRARYRLAVFHFFVKFDLYLKVLKFILTDVHISCCSSIKHWAFIIVFIFVLWPLNDRVSFFQTRLSIFILKNKRGSRPSPFMGQCSRKQNQWRIAWKVNSVAMNIGRYWRSFVLRN